MAEKHQDLGMLLYFFKILSWILHAMTGQTHACRFSPTCSEFFSTALKSQGLIRGLFLGVRRVFRCHPWGGQGWDPVPARGGR